MPSDGAEEDYDGQGSGHNPFIVRHARVWSRALTVQLVSGGNVSKQCFNPKQKLHCEKDFAS